jgi:hypothetical protein
VFPDVQGLPFAHDGISPDFLRAGEPRLVRFRGNDRPATVRSLAIRRTPSFRRLLRTVTP